MEVLENPRGFGKVSKSSGMSSAVLFPLAELPGRLPGAIWPSWESYDLKKTSLSECRSETPVLQTNRSAPKEKACLAAFVGTLAVPPWAS